MVYMTCTFSKHSQHVILNSCHPTADALLFRLIYKYCVQPTAHHEKLSNCVEATGKVKTGSVAFLASFLFGELLNYILSWQNKFRYKFSVFWYCKTSFTKTSVSWHSCTQLLFFFITVNYTTNRDCVNSKLNNLWLNVLSAIVTIGLGLPFSLSS